ncbi:MAG: YbgA family protein [Bacteriovoracaceae bacterium]
MKKPLIGISSCLLGNSVRYDGTHKKYNWVVDELSAYVDFYPICPEVEMGLGVPRETVRLEKKEKDGPVQMVSNKNKTNLTRLAKDTAKFIYDSLPSHLDGFILKKDSPSCGPERVKIYYKDMPFEKGAGIFADHLINNSVDYPIIHEGRLHNPELREDFIIRVWGHFNVNQLKAKIKDIQDLHKKYKFVLLSFDEPSFRELGRICANNDNKKPSEVLELYRKTFMKALSSKRTRKKQANALQHIYGFLKNELKEKEKKNILKLIDRYRENNLPFVALATMMQHLIDISSNEYIKDQSYFFPYPEKLELFLDL